MYVYKTYIHRCICEYYVDRYVRCMPCASHYVFHGCAETPPSSRNKEYSQSRYLFIPILNRKKNSTYFPFLQTPITYVYNYFYFFMGFSLLSSASFPLFFLRPTVQFWLDHMIVWCCYYTSRWQKENKTRKNEASSSQCRSVCALSSHYFSQQVCWERRKKKKQ